MFENKQFTTHGSNRDDHSIAVTFLKNLSGLRSYLSNFFHSSHDIEDVLQDAYIRAIEAEKLKQIRTPKAFLYKVCKNLAINHHNKAAQKLTDYIEDFDELNVIDTGVSVEEQIEQENRFAQFCNSVKLLPPQCRRVFVLKKVYGLSNKEIAKQLAISVSTVDKHLGHGLVVCRNYLEQKGYKFDTDTQTPKRYAATK